MKCLAVTGGFGWFRGLAVSRGFMGSGYLRGGPVCASLFVVFDGVKIDPKPQALQTPVCQASNALLLAVAIGSQRIFE